MSPSLPELLSALPLPDEPATREDEDLRRLFASLASRPVPTSPLRRLWSMGSLPGKIALAYAAYWIRSGYRTADDKERLLNETHLRAAIRLLSEMAYLRGLAAKLGQFLSLYPDMVPEAFADTLGRLHFEAPPMHFSLLREQVRRELGDDPESLFAAFESTAFAAASLGQVHRARLKSGEDVAVKIQYPDMARTIASDFRTLLALMTPMRLSRDWDSLRGGLDDARRMLEWETDYRREARYLHRAAAVFKPEEGIVVPRVFESLSSERVLTMEYLDGVHLDDYLATRPSQEERDRVGRLIMLSSFRIAHAAEFWYADANPGNFLFLRDGRVGVIDFGCCREFSREEWDYYKHMYRAHREGGEAKRQAMIRAADLDPDGPVDSEHITFLVNFSNWWMEYLDHDGPYDFGDASAMRRGLEFMTQAARQSYWRSHPVNTWIFRQLLGLRSIVHRLGARIDMKTLDAQESKGVLF